MSTTPQSSGRALLRGESRSFIPIQISVSNDKLYVANVGTLPEDWTLEKLLGKHSSRPHNPTIASCVYLTGKIETWGRGIRKVFDECARHGCPPPVYEVSTGDPGDIQVRIDAAPDAIVEEQAEDPSVGHTEPTTLKTTPENSTTTPETTPENSETTPETSMVRIFRAVKKSPRITVSELSNITGLSIDGVKWNLRKLKSLGKIRRVGYTKGGHWEVIES